MILTEGQFGAHHAQDRDGRDPLRRPTRSSRVLDSSIAGRNVSEWLPGHDIPAVATLAEALALPEPPDTLLIGIAPTGGKLPADWRATILEAIDAGLDVHSGPAHVPRRRPGVRRGGRAPRASRSSTTAGRRSATETAIGRPHEPGKRVILTVGTDCAIGKMSVALELRKARSRRPATTAVFVPTGQTGMMIDGWGVAVDRVISDFVQGTVEWMIEEAEARGDWIIVEGQGSLDHPAYSSVTLGLIHGATPQAMVMVHKPGIADHDFDHLAGRLVPDREAARVHPASTRRSPASSRRRRSSAIAAEHDALPGRGRGAPGRRGDRARRRACRPTIRCASAATGCGPRSTRRSTPCRGSRARARRRRRRPQRVVTLEIRHEVLRLALRDPFRIARSEHDAGTR